MPWMGPFGMSLDAWLTSAHIGQENIANLGEITEFPTRSRFESDAVVCHFFGGT